MSSAVLLISKVRDLLDDHLSLDDFEDWFLANNWNPHLHFDANTVAFVHRIEGLLLDFSSDSIDEQSMRAEFANAILHFEAISQDTAFGFAQL